MQATAAGYAVTYFNAPKLSSQVTWAVVILTTAKFKSLMLPVLGFS
jgi:hypothetical protein